MKKIKVILQILIVLVPVILMSYSTMTDGILSDVIKTFAYWTVVVLLLFAMDKFGKWFNSKLK